jgi:pantoate--beta-alanine ligase
LIVTHTIRECRDARASLGRLALVPTMGALHAGHLSLVERGKAVAPRVAMTIFVNPTQFGPKEDFSRYPRPIERDLDLCRDAGVDLVFVPPVEDIYPPGTPQATIDVPALTTKLEGKHRPGHFAGVCQVVAKLFNITTPQAACFGEKDFQQLAVLRAMVTALDFDIEMIGCPTLRDPDGLAMSSRNRYLSADERVRALSISRSLFDVASKAKAGERNVGLLQRSLYESLADRSAAPDVITQIDYAAIVDRTTLAEAATLDRPAQAVVAMRVGATRLIDNIAID